MSLINSLEKTGLTEKQARVYLACLELGGARVTDIAKKAKIKRTTCYHLLNDLMNLGLVSKSKQKKSGFFLAEDPRKIEQEIKERLELVQDILPELKAVHNVLPQKPKISFYEGWESAKMIYDDILKTLHPGDTILSFRSFKEIEEYIPKWWIEKYQIQKRIEKKIRIRALTHSSPLAEELKKSASKELREIKIVPEESWPFTTDMKIYANKVMLISPKENFMSILIESKEIANMLRIAFELMWKGADSP